MDTSEKELKATVECLKDRAELSKMRVEWMKDVQQVLAVAGGVGFGPDREVPDRTTDGRPGRGVVPSPSGGRRDRPHDPVRAVGAAHRAEPRAQGGLVVQNVAALSEPPKHRAKEIQPFTPEQARTLLAAAKGHRLGAVVSVSTALGLRLGEALGLRWQDVDFDAGRSASDSHSSGAAGT